MISLLDTKEEIKEIRSKRGKKSRADGKLFELKTRKDLESRGWIVCKYGNTVEFDEDGNGKIIIAKSKYNPFLKRVINEGSGWPDHLAIRHDKEHPELFNVIGVESKRAKYLDNSEKRMATFYLDNKIFTKIYIAYPIKQGRHTQIVYQQFER